MLAAAGLAAFAACAHVEPPPGGPEDRDPPGVLVTRPENEAVVPGYDGPAIFVFDERISERGVQEAVSVSPRTSPVIVRGGRDEVRVELRGGWLPGHIYHVSLGTEIRDLFGNPLTSVERLVFSTGPAIPDTRATGTVLDRIDGRARQGMRVEAIRLADSLVYAVTSDSAGAFLIDRIPPGEYQLRAFEDMNRNRSLEPFEPRDSVIVTIAEAEPVEASLSLLLPDSTPPTIASASLQPGRILVEFDDFLDPEQEVAAGQVTIAGPAGAVVPVEAVGIGTPPVADTTGAPRPPATTAGDRPLPSQRLFILLPDSVTLEPNAEYTVRITGIRNINGLTADAETEMRTPPAAPGALGLVSRRAPRRYIASLRRRNVSRSGMRRPRATNWKASHSHWLRALAITSIHLVSGPAGEGKRARNGRT